MQPCDSPDLSTNAFEEQLNIGATARAHGPSYQFGALQPHKAFEHCEMIGDAVVGFPDNIARIANPRDAGGWHWALAVLGYAGTWKDTATHDVPSGRSARSAPLHEWLRLSGPAADTFDVDQLTRTASGGAARSRDRT